VFAYQKFQFGYLLEALVMENVGIFITLWFIVWAFSIFFRFGCCRKNLATLVLNVPEFLPSADSEHRKQFIWDTFCRAIVFLQISQNFKTFFS
jgi:hypothetical protein